MPYGVKNAHTTANFNRFISPRRVLCPWRAHSLSCQLLAGRVARATAGRFVRCEWLVGRNIDVPRGPDSDFCVSCSPHGWPSVVRGLSHWRRESARPPFSRLSRTHISRSGPAAFAAKTDGHILGAIAAWDGIAIKVERPCYINITNAPAPSHVAGAAVPAHPRRT